MKVGDKVYCKKDSHTSSGNWFTADCWYEIVYYDNGNILNIRNNYGSRCAFNINHVKNHWADIELFNEYFYTIKEYRKLKLEKIYEGR